MITITDAASFGRAFDAPIAPEIKRLLVHRRDQLLTDTGGEYDIGELAHFIVVEADPPDTTAEIEAAAGYPLITDSSFEWVEDHGGMFETATILSDTGWGIVLLVPDDNRIEPALIDLLRSRAMPAQSSSQASDQVGTPATP